WDTAGQVGTSGGISGPSAASRCELNWIDSILPSPASERHQRYVAGRPKIAVQTPDRRGGYLRGGGRTANPRAGRAKERILISHDMLSKIANEPPRIRSVLRRSI